MRVLLVEDDELIAEQLVKTLSDQHYAVDVAADGQAGLDLASGLTYDLILLDVVLPKLDGISLCRQLRSQGNRTPVLLLTAQDATTNKVKGLDAGADDYLSKPFDLQELLARIRALLRRGSADSTPLLKWQNLHLDPSSCEVHYQGQPLHLTPKEYSLLELFLRNRQRVFSCGAILDHLWALEEAPTEDTVRAHIKGLRMKLRTAGLTDDPIETVYGIGYRLKPVKPPADQVDPDSTSQSEPRAEQSTRLTPELEQQTRSGVADIWERVKGKLGQRISFLEEAAVARQQGRMSEELRTTAAQVAHKLTGSLGMFGCLRGSELAQELEQLLQRATLTRSQQRHLTKLIHDLRQEAQQIHWGQQPELSPADDRPFLLIVTSDLVLGEQLVTTATVHQIRAEIVTDFTVVKSWMINAATEDSPLRRPDVVLLDLDNAQGEASLSLLPELKAYTPAIPALVLTQGELIDRVKVAHLGGRFCLQKPILPAEVIDAVQQTLAQLQAMTAKIMVVDDDLQVLNSLQSLLEPWGFKVTTLDNPLKFWANLETAAPDLLILDVEMPGINGIQLCQVVRNDLHWNHLPVLFLTVHTDIEIMQQVFAAGADDFVNKPIVGPELITRILNRLERSRLLRIMAESDTLTGVANRHKSTQDLNQYLHQAAQQHQPLCFAVLELSRFKQINEQYGHAVGDEVLCYLAKLLRQQFQGVDVIGRWGGGEFVVGMYGMNCHEGTRRLSEVLERLHQKEFLVADKGFHTTFCAGVVQFPQDGTDLITLYQAAINVQQQAQASGCDRVA